MKVDILTFNGFFDSISNILKPRWLLTKVRREHAKSWSSPRSIEKLEDAGLLQRSVVEIELDGMSGIEDEHAVDPWKTSKSIRGEVGGL